MGKISDYEAIVTKIKETADQNDLLKFADEFSKKIISMFEFEGSIEVDPKTLIDKMVEMFIQKGYSFNTSKFVDFTMRAGKEKVYDILLANNASYAFIEKCYMSFFINEEEFVNLVKKSSTISDFISAINIIENKELKNELLDSALKIATSVDEFETLASLFKSDNESKEKILDKVIELKNPEGIWSFARSAHLKTSICKEKIESALYELDAPNSYLNLILYLIDSRYNVNDIVWPKKLEEKLLELDHIGADSYQFLNQYVPKQMKNLDEDTLDIDKIESAFLMKGDIKDILDSFGRLKNNNPVFQERERTVEDLYEMYMNSKEKGEIPEHRFMYLFLLLGIPFDYDYWRASKMCVEYSESEDLYYYEYIRTHMNPTTFISNFGNCSDNPRVEEITDRLVKKYLYTPRNFKADKIRAMKKH